MSMLSSEIKLRVRYAETDQMGYVYYGNYAAYFEVGRVELLRKLGTSYRTLEESGVMLPVLEYKVNYKKPALYDDEIKVVTTIKELPSVRITFYYEIFNEQNELLNTAETTLVFVDKSTNRPCKAPEWFLAKFNDAS